MKITSLGNAAKIKPLKYPLHEVPHATIEPNRTCNLQCVSCYNIDRRSVKPFQEIKKEINQICTRRKVEVITIVGGEPTLHEDIIKIIAYIKSKGLICQMFTNGVTILEDDDGALIAALKDAELDRIFLHVDIGQSGRENDSKNIMLRLFRMCEKNQLHYSLAVTLYENNSAMIPTWIRRYAKYKYFNGIFAVPAKNPRGIFPAEGDLEKEHKHISDQLGIEPTTYVPSSRNDAEVKWLIYYYFLETHSVGIIPISPILYRLIYFAMRQWRGYYPFALRLTNTASKFLLPFVAVAEGIINITEFSFYIKSLLQFILAGFDMRFHFIVIQEPPHRDDSTNELVICYHCPDATFRNGFLMPVCVADRIAPLRSGLDDNRFPQKIISRLQEQLNEIITDDYA
jgi:hypothetical protein